MKRIFFILFLVVYSELFAQEYIKINNRNLLKDGSFDKTEIELLFDSNGFLKKYLSTRYALGEVTTKKVECSWNNNTYNMVYNIKNDINANPKDFSFTYSYEKIQNGWKEYADGELINTIIHKNSPNLQIIQNSYKNETIYLFDRKKNTVNLYGNNYILINGIFKKTNTDLSSGEKIYVELLNDNSFIIHSSYEGHTVDYNVEFFYNCKNDNLIEMLFALQFFDLPIEIMPFIVIKNDFIYQSTSYLTEDKTTYEPEHLQYKDGLPWASGNGSGIGDVISIKDFIHTNPADVKLLNGYQDSNHKDYYDKNSRAKKIKVINKTTGKSKILEIKDTRDEQMFNISDLGTGNYFDFEILDVYEGNKYKDLCIQYLVLE